MKLKESDLCIGLNINGKYILKLHTKTAFEAMGIRELDPAALELMSSVPNVVSLISKTSNLKMKKDIAKFASIVTGKKLSVFDDTILTVIDDLEIPDAKVKMFKVLYQDSGNTYTFRCMKVKVKVGKKVNKVWITLVRPPKHINSDYVYWLVSKNHKTPWK